MKDQLGRKEATTLMDLLPATNWGEIATGDDVRQSSANHGLEFRGEMAKLRGEMAEIRGDLALTRGELHDRIASTESRLTHLIIGFALSIYLAMAAAVVTVIFAA
jgi:hypothetical protein